MSWSVFPYIFLSSLATLATLNIHFTLSTIFSSLLPLPTLLEGFHPLWVQLLYLFWWLPDLFSTDQLWYIVVVLRYLKLMSKKLCISPFLKLLLFFLWFVHAAHHSVRDTRILTLPCYYPYVLTFPHLTILLFTKSCFTSFIYFFSVATALVQIIIIIWTSM